jgi:hypothetical protein
MRLGYPLLSALLVLSISTVSSFPISGGNGQLNATVFGVIWGSTSEDNNMSDIYIDVAIESHLSGIQVSCLNYTAMLIDEKGRSYQRADEICLGERNLLGFRVPKNDGIKQLKLEFEKGVNISMNWKPIILINWENPPEATADNLTMKFYDAKKSEVYYNGWRDWYFDVKLTNEGKEKQLVALRDFTVRDQYGWDYTSGNLKCELLPGESMRFYIPVHYVSEISKPTMLKYGNMSIDVSGWT